MNDATLENIGRLGTITSGESDIDAESSLHRTTDFRMYCFKVLPCSKRFCHDWTTCPFAHPGEKARRRDPRTYKYSGIACPEMKLGHVCPRGVSCPFAHNVFEYWLHPTRYRTQPCNDGPACSRRVCFFAHTLDELRVPSEIAEMDDSPADEQCEKIHSSCSRAFDGLDKILADTTVDDKRPTSNASYQSATSIRSDCDGSNAKLEFMEGMDERQDASDLFEGSDTMIQSPLHNLKSTSQSSTCASSDSELMALAELEQHHLPYLEQNVNDLLNSDCDERSHESIAQGGYFIDDSQASFIMSSNSALESGFHWNGGPPKLFITSAISNELSELGARIVSGQSIFGFSYDCENYPAQQLVSDESWLNAASHVEPFLLASLLSNFQCS